MRNEPSLHHDHFDLLVLHNHRHHLGWSNVEVGPDAECRVGDTEPFAEVVNNNERIPTEYGNLHSSSKIIIVVLRKHKELFFVVAVYYKPPVGL